MGDADGVDLVLGPSRLGVEDATGNLLGFVAGVPQGDGLEGTDGEIRVQRGVVRELFEFLRPELSRGDLVGLDARALQD